MMNRRILAILLASCVAWSTSGCATIFSPGPDLVPISTRPQGARVSLDGVPLGTSPLIVAVDRRSEGVFTFDLAGYEKKTVDRDKVLNGMLCLNLGWIILWPVVPIGLLIDVACGNAGKYSVQPLNVELTPLAPKAGEDCDD